MCLNKFNTLSIALTCFHNTRPVLLTAGTLRLGPVDPLPLSSGQIRENRDGLQRQTHQRPNNDLRESGPEYEQTVLVGERTR